MTNYIYSKCAICGTNLVYNPKQWFCSKCYKTYQKDIEEKIEWTIYLRREERNRRYRKQDMRKLGISYVYGLGSIFDYSADTGLVPLKEYYEEE